MVIDGRLHGVHPDDVEAVAERLKVANEPNVLPRPLSEYRAAVEKGALFAVTVNGEVEAVSGIFDSGTATHGELGGTFVAEPIRGFGLQRILFRARFGAAVIGLDRGVRLVTGIKADNTKSLENMRESGFEAWADPIPSLLAACQTCPKLGSLTGGRRCCCDFYLLPPEAHVKGVKELLAFPDLLTLTRSNDDVMQLRLDVKMVTEESYRAALQAFVDGQW